jgi:hypothetical protein
MLARAREPLLVAAATIGVSMPVKFPQKFRLKIPHFVA